MSTQSLSGTVKGLLLCWPGNIAKVWERSLGSLLFPNSSNSLSMILCCTHRPCFHSSCVYCIQGRLQNITFVFPMQVAVYSQSQHTCEKWRGSSIFWRLREIFSAYALQFGSSLTQHIFYKVLIQEDLFLLRIYWALPSLKNLLLVHLSSLCLPVSFHLKPNIFSPWIFHTLFLLDRSSSWAFERN